jgi:predicted deacetylase
MRYVVLRDDDTNALTPVECLERLYRPFLERGLAVNLAVIPKVRTDAVARTGLPEGFLLAKNGPVSKTLPISSQEKLVRYLREHPGYHIVQHGYHHIWNEFNAHGRDDIRHRLHHGTQLLMEAGFARPQTFVAPYDKLSRTSLAEVPKRFRVLSTGWFDLCRLPVCWWPRYALKKMLKRPHWRVGRTILLSHAGRLLSFQRPYDTMLEQVKQAIGRRCLTVLVTHWWEYFRKHEPDERFIRVLHETAAWLAGQPEIKVVSFDEVATGAVPLN